MIIHVYVYLRPYQGQRQHDGWAFIRSSGRNVRSTAPAAEAKPVIHRRVEPCDDVRYAPATKAVFSHAATFKAHLACFIVHHRY